MKTIEQEIRKRLAAENLSPENVEKALAYIKADPLLRGMRYCWADTADVFSQECMETFWLSCWSSARDWMMAQLTAPVTKEGE